MKRTETTPPYLSWCLIVRNCAETLEATFKSLRARTPQAEIVVVDTMSSDDGKTWEICQRYADVLTEYRGPNNDWTREMYAFDDASAARTESFRLASGTWVAWVDSDDRVVDPVEAERLLKLNNRWKPHRRDQVVEGEAEAPQQLEDLLKKLDTEHPAATMIFCPYLYQRDEHDQAITWQERERFVKWLGKDGKPRFRWAEAGHEILVPIGHVPPRVDLAHLLWVHEKKFTRDDYAYSVQRHFDAIHKLYLQPGGKTTRRCLYLANFAGIGGICPEREWEFLAAAHETCATALDRYRVLIDIGNYYGSRGLYWDAIESFCAAQGLRPDLPDAWFSGADRAIGADDHVRAVAWLERGLACELHPESLINPRFMVTRYPTLLQLELRELGRKLITGGRHDEALATLQKASVVAYNVMAHDAIGEDRIEGKSRYYRADNEYRAHKAMMALREHFQYLLDNDESQKALEVLKAVPWNGEDHPLVIEMEKLAEPIRRHLTDPAAYTKFYQEETTSYSPTLTEQYEFQEGRAGWAAQVIAAFHPKGRIFEVGPCDGTFAIPILRKCPDVTYLGYDLMDQAIDGFKAAAEKYGLSDRVDLKKINAGDPYPGEEGATYDAKFDVILYGEVVEHVQDPVHELSRLRDLLTPDGMLILTTPWGSFDAGHPPPLDNAGEPRGNLGHVRALSPRGLYEMLDAAWLRVVEMMDVVANSDAILGWSLCVVAKRQQMRLDVEHPPKDPLSVYGYTARGPRPDVAFCVAGALWDWNGRTVEAYGIGASEETIVYLARHWANMPVPRRAEVFGPVPRPDVRTGVAYWPKAQLRHLHERTDLKLIVSRAPAWGPYIKSIAGDHKQILWLQDAFYPDLTAELADTYETIVVLTEWHKQEMHKLHGVPLDKMEIVPNFLLPEQFLQPVEKKNDHFIYASSPDRGLIKLLELWPRILERYPDATLDVFYGWKGCETLSRTNPDWTVLYRQLRPRYEKLRFQKGVADRGMVNHQAIARAYLKAGVWAYPTAFCLHGDSRISVPGDHRGGPPTVAIKDLVGKTNFPVYAYDAEAHQFKIATALWVAQTKIAPELVELELDDGQVLRCTPDHRIMNFDDEWVEAGDVQVGTRLRALHYRYNVAIKDGNGRWTNEHRLVGEWLAGRPLRTDEHVDHSDLLRLDNRPETLQVMSAADHMSKTSKNRPLTKRHKNAIGERTRRMAKENPKFIRERNAKGGRTWQARLRAMSDEERATLWAKRDAKKTETIRKLWADPEWAAAQQAKMRANRQPPAVEMRAEIAARAWRTRKEKYGPKGRAVPRNHQVVAVRRIPGGPVYDMEVAGLHNMIADGVVVHNCETFCSNAIKARAGGAIPVTTALAALNETAACSAATLIAPDDPMYEEKFLEAVFAAVEADDSVRQPMMEEARDKYALSAVVPLWDRIVGK